jgi:hypothetical protein
MSHVEPAGLSAQNFLPSTTQWDRMTVYEGIEYKCTAGLLLSREEFREMCRNRYPPVRLIEDDLLNWVYKTTSGYVGAISALLRSFEIIVYVICH